MQELDFSVVGGVAYYDIMYMMGLSLTSVDHHRYRFVASFSVY